jgi:fucose 4-O-acetylase-like acetyltransferase
MFDRQKALLSPPQGSAGTQKQRSYMFDNLKALLIFLVVLGHMFSLMHNDVTISLYRCIYSFHMPLFIFVSGYFSKNLDKSYRNAFESCLLPYIVFQIVYTLIFESPNTLNIFLPQYAMWYLLSLFLMKVSARYLLNIKFILPISFIVAIYTGCLSSVTAILSLSRTLVFLPFFLMGVMCTEETIERIRKFPKWLTAPVLLLLMTVMCLPEEYLKIPTAMFEGSTAYHWVDLSLIHGSILRGVLMLAAVIASICVINLVSGKRNFFSALGERTIVIYILHIALRRWAETLIGYYNLGPQIAQINEFALTGIYFAAAVAITALFSMPFFHKGYTWSMGKLAKLISVDKRS